MKFITTTDARSGEEIKLHYSDLGEGAPVVLIHGWPLDKHMWEYQVMDLVPRGIRCILYDRRGFGQSSKPWTGYDYDAFADDLKAVLDQLELENVTLVGFSMGGGEVARYFSRHGGARVSKAVLVSSILPFMLKTDDNPNGVPQEQFEEMAKGMKDDRPGFMAEFGKTFYGVGFLNKTVSDAFLANNLRLAMQASPEATLEAATAFGTTDFRTEMATINVPTLIIHGDADKTVPIETSGEAAAKLIPNNTYVVYEGAPHGLFYTEKERLNADLANFVLGTSA